MTLFRSSGFSRAKPLSAKKTHIVSVLDIGSSMIVCMIARLTPRAESQTLPGRTARPAKASSGLARGTGGVGGAAVQGGVTAGPRVSGDTAPSSSCRR